MDDFTGRGQEYEWERNGGEGGREDVPDQILTIIAAASSSGNGSVSGSGSGNGSVSGSGSSSKSSGVGSGSGSGGGGIVVVVVVVVVVAVVVAVILNLLTYFVCRLNATESYINAHIYEPVCLTGDVFPGRCSCVQENGCGRLSYGPLSVLQMKDGSSTFVCFNSTAR